MWRGQVSYGKSSRYRDFSRVLKVSNSTAVAFTGDHADFQYIKSLIDDKLYVADWRWRNF